MANLIRAVMLQKGVTFEKLAEETGLSVGYLSKMAKGTRNVSLKNLEKIANGIATASGEPVGVEELVAETQEVAVAGKVGAGEKITFVDDFPLGEGLYKVTVPAALGTVVGVEIEGDSMWPRYLEGEVVLYGAVEGPQSLIGRECVIRLTDHTTYLKRLRRGSREGVYNLESVKGGPLEDQEVEWAAAVKWPKRQRRPV